MLDDGGAIYSIGVRIKMTNALFYSFVLLLNVISVIFHDTKNDYLAVMFAAILSMNALIIPGAVILLFDSLLLKVKNRFNIGNDRF